MLRLVRLALAVSMLAVASGPASAHAFGERYELPVPVWLFIGGGAVTVTATFVLIALFIKTGPGRAGQRVVDLSRNPAARLLTCRWVQAAVKLMAMLLLILAILTGFLGVQDPHSNITPTLIWIVGWNALTYVAMLIGNPWLVANPWRAAFDLVSREGAAQRSYPAWLGVWPAVALLFVFGWIELIFPFSSKPMALAWLLLAYSALTFWGMRRFGAQAWLENADPFHVAFDLFARFAPLAPKPGGGLILRPYAAGLLDPLRQGVSTAMMCFVLGLLSIVLFDGFLGSGHWIAIENVIHAAAPKMSDATWVGIHTVAFAAVWAIFLGLFLLGCAAMRALGEGPHTTFDLARAFALTLIPIAVGYHFAHTFQYLLVQGQGMAMLISDPFGFGWNLFGTLGHEIDMAVMSAKTAWYLAVGAIVVGHVISVYLAHVVAARLYETRGRVLSVLMPMTVLMVAYTIVSLQILAEPLVKYTGS